MTTVLYAAEIWLLLAMLIAWFIGRAAPRLRQPPSTLAEYLAGDPAPEGTAAEHPSAADVGSLWRGLRIFDGV